MDLLLNLGLVAYSSCLSKCLTYVSGSFTFGSLAPVAEPIPMLDYVCPLSVGV